MTKKTAFFSKMWGYITLFLMGAAAFFFILFNKEKAKHLKSKIKGAEEKAKNVAKERHEKSKSNGTIGVANSIIDKLNSKND